MVLHNTSMGVEFHPNLYFLFLSLHCHFTFFVAYWMIFVNLPCVCVLCVVSFNCTGNCRVCMGMGYVIDATHLQCQPSTQEGSISLKLICSSSRRNKNDEDEDCGLETVQNVSFEQFDRMFFVHFMFVCTSTTLGFIWMFLAQFQGPNVRYHGWLICCHRNNIHVKLCWTVAYTVDVDVVKPFPPCIRCLVWLCMWVILALQCVGSILIFYFYSWGPNLKQRWFNFHVLENKSP